VLGIWVNCRDDSCSLTLLYHANRQSYEVTFDNVGPLYDEAWHKLAVHVTGVRTGRSVSASVYVDCALQGTKSLLEDYNFLLPFVNKKATSSQIWLGQRSRGYRGGFEKPWRVLYDLWKNLSTHLLAHKESTEYAICALWVKMIFFFFQGSLQNFKFVFNREIEKLTDETVCSSLRETRKKHYFPPVTDKGKWRLFCWSPKILHDNVGDVQITMGV
jgi:frataxin-like iron-binding protein CyaY